MKNSFLIILALTLAFAPLASLAAPVTSPLDCTGGTIVHTGGYTIHTFAVTGTTSFTCPDARSVEYLVVAGGGGGGGQLGGGGGAGGLLAGTGFAVAAGSALTVTVGAGGASNTGTTAGTSGGNSVFSSITATGGGGGGGNDSGAGPPANGGSGGGGSGSSAGTGTAGQGHDGGVDPASATNHSGGGGGAGSIGLNGAAGVGGGAGGTGQVSTITGSSVFYAGGGGGASYDVASGGGAGGTGGGGRGGTFTPFTQETSGSANTGGGAGGAVTGTAGSTGGSGIVIVRYPTQYTTYTYTGECTGGTITHANGYTVHTFATSTYSSFTCPQARSVEYLVVGGGGGGAGTNAGGGGFGGGGAGGFTTATGYAVAANSAITVTVGGGGNGGAANGTGDGVAGSNSVFGSITALGGGYGIRNQSTLVSGDGGSGGGAGSAGQNYWLTGNGIAGQGNAGGAGYTGPQYNGGSGGGSGTVGISATASSGGIGGAGTASAISGTTTYYAGGGGGGTYTGSVAAAGGIGGGGAGGLTNAAGTAGTANTGGGGGGAASNTTAQAGGAGGSGIVIVRYPTKYQVYKFTTECTGGTITHAAGYTVHTFTTPGSTTFTCSNYGTVEYLVVAGGGGGGGGPGVGYASSGGGGGGGFVTGTGLAVAANSAVTVTVGAGGTAGPSGNNLVGGGNGNNSVFSSITAIGGGGGSVYGYAGSAGGSGGGSGGAGPVAGGAGTSGQGNSGGSATGNNYSGGSGGGAGAAGGYVATNTTGAAGGAGLASSISGSAVFYAGGGGVGPYSAGSGSAGGNGGGGAGGNLASNGNAGTANTGGGGGSSAGNGVYTGGAGGSGIVIVRYVTPQAPPASAKYKILGGKYSFMGGTFKFNYTANTAPATRTYIENVFSAYTYTGNSPTGQTITNGINLSGLGGLVWQKNREQINWHHFNDSVRGVTNYVYSNSTAAQTASSAGHDLTAFTSSGFTLGTDEDGFNTNNIKHISWSFAQAPKFFKTAQVTVSGGVDATVDLSSLGTVGMVAVKRTDSTSAWFTWHRSLTSGKLLYLNTGDNETTDGSITLSGTTLTLEGGVIANGTYIVYAYAHDTSTNGLIQCGAVAGSSSPGTYVTLGWEPQYILLKRSIGGADVWRVLDSARGFSMTNNQLLVPTDTRVEAAIAPPDFVPTATGFLMASTGFGAGNTVVYCAIRRGPMQQPGNGLQVYNAIVRTGTATASTVTGAGFPPDLVINVQRNHDIGQGNVFFDRLRGAPAYLASNATGAEQTGATDSLIGFDVMDGVRIGADTNGLAGGYLNKIYVWWFFRRYPGVFDEVAYTGTGSATTISHNLGVVPEMMIVKERSSVRNWPVYHVTLGNASGFILDSTAANGWWGSGDSIFNNTTPTNAVFSVGTNSLTNRSTGTYVAYLFASKPGVSKVGSYTGDGSNGKVINANFASSARFVMIKRTDNTSDWFVWDSTRGITANANDPHLSLNTTVAEVTTDDSIDPNSSGFMVKQNTATNINVASATYIYLAFQ